MLLRGMWFAVCMMGGTWYVTVWYVIMLHEVYNVYGMQSSDKIRSL